MRRLNGSRCRPRLVGTCVLDVACMAQEHSLALTLVLWSLPSPPSAVLVCLPPHVQIVEGVGVRGGQWLAEVGALWVEGTCALSQGPPQTSCLLTCRRRPGHKIWVVLLHELK